MSRKVFKIHVHRGGVGKPAFQESFKTVSFDLLGNDTGIKFTERATGRMRIFVLIPFEVEEMDTQEDDIEEGIH